MGDMTAFKIGVIIGSTRVVRIGPQVADFVLDTLRSQSGRLAGRVVWDRIDLQDQHLPIFDEPVIPQHVRTVEGYHQEHTKAWSRRIAANDAFVFIAAQRNWGIPAELKNSIDYLYHEWHGKPAMLVTYGGHGGVQCAEQLRTVLGSLKMRLSTTPVHMSFPDAEFRGRAFKGEAVGLDAQDHEAPWAEHRSQMVQAYEEMIAALEQDASGRPSSSSGNAKV